MIKKRNKETISTVSNLAKKMKNIRKKGKNMQKWILRNKSHNKEDMYSFLGKKILWELPDFQDYFHWNSQAKLKSFSMQI